MSRYKTIFCIIPRRLARHCIDQDKDSLNQSQMEFIGWVWMQRASLVKNINHGWVSFLDHKPPELPCPTCKQILPECKLF